MNILPKSHDEFAQKDYWNRFFKSRGDKAFEWYGEYLELCELIHKYVKKKDKILMLGCGTSKLGSDMYDAGFKDITNIDISGVAVHRMQELNSAKRSDMKFIQMDATNMAFHNDEFTVALDKGTLDALFVNDLEETKSIIQKYLMEITRTMRFGGRYLCITLLQDHILKYIVEYFPTHSFMLRIVHCSDVESANREKNIDKPDAIYMPVFLVVATKFKNVPQSILEFSFTSNSNQRLNSGDELISAVKSVQKAALVCNGLARNSLVGHNEVTMELCKPGENRPRFTIHILDQPAQRGLGRYAVFIVPQGGESEWLFSTPEGRRKLLSCASYQRLAVVVLHHDQTYTSLNDVKAELNDNIKYFAPADLKDQIPFLSLGDEIGKREILVCGVSKISGEFRVEEVEKSKGQLFRRLIFLNNEFVIQSESLIKKIKPKRKKEIKKVDFGALACKHHLYMSIGVQMAVRLSDPKKSLKDILVVGLGGGGLCSFLYKSINNIYLTAVEIDPMMLEVAEQFFDLKQDERFHVVIDDGISFIDKCKTQGITFDAILFDVDSKDTTLGMSCPPANFLSSSVLETVKTLISPNGVFILNLVCRNDDLRENVVKNLKSFFPALCTYKLSEDINEVIFCMHNGGNCQALSEWRDLLGKSTNALIDSVKINKLHNDDLLDNIDFIKDLKI